MSEQTTIPKNGQLPLAQDYEMLRAEGLKHIESLASAVSTGILKNFSKVQSVTVRVRKPSAPVKGVIDYVEVELTETRRI